VAGETIAAIGPGLLVLIGIGRDDTEDDGAWLAGKCIALLQDAAPQRRFNAVDILSPRVEATCCWAWPLPREFAPGGGPWW